MSSVRDFQDSLAFGHAGESIVSRWLLSQGHTVIPIGSPNYTLHSHQGGAPVAYKGSRAIVCPDLMCKTSDGMRWVEVKQKSRFAWYRRGQCWNTGIDDRLWTHYRDCERRGCLVLDYWFRTETGQLTRHTRKPNPQPGTLWKIANAKRGGRR